MELTPQVSGPPPGAVWIRVVLWAILLMVVAGVGVVWWATDREARQARHAIEDAGELPILSRLPELQLTSRDGSEVELSDLAGRPWVVDAIFTRCGLTCPRMTSKMLALGAELPPGVGRISISVDPEHDDPAILAEYARSHGVADDADWLFLTGAPEAIRRVVLDGLLLGYGATEAEGEAATLEPITHSTRFVLLDGEGQVRGYYDAFEPADVDRLVRDAGRLMAAGVGA